MESSTSLNSVLSFPHQNRHKPRRQASYLRVHLKDLLTDGNDTNLKQTWSRYKLEMQELKIAADPLTRQKSEIAKLQTS